MWAYFWALYSSPLIDVSDFVPASTKELYQKMLGWNNLRGKISYDEDLSFANRSLMLVKDLLERMDIEAKIYLMEEDDEKVLIDIDAKDDSAILIGKQGKTLEANQNIVNVIMNKD